MVHDAVDRPHLVHLFGGVGLAQEEDLAGELLAHLLGQVRTAVATVETADVGIGLLEPGMLAAGKGQIANDVQAVPAAGRPSVDQADHHLGHEPDQALNLEDVQSAGPRGVHRVGGFAGRVLVAAAAPDALVPAGAERPPTVLGRGPVSGQQHHPHLRPHPGVIERPVQLVDGVRPKGVPHLRSIECDPDRRLRHPVAQVAVIGDVGEVLESLDGLPQGRVERVLTHGDDGTSAPNATVSSRIVCGSLSRSP